MSKLKPVTKLTRLAVTKDLFEVPVGITIDGVIQDPTLFDPSWTLVEEEADPAGGEWKTGSWSTDNTGATLARLVLGPGGDFVMARGSVYDLYLRLSDPPLAPVYGPWRITAT